MLYFLFLWSFYVLLFFKYSRVMVVCYNFNGFLFNFYIRKSNLCDTTGFTILWFTSFYFQNVHFLGLTDEHIRKTSCVSFLFSYFPKYTHGRAYISIFSCLLLCWSSISHRYSCMVLGVFMSTASSPNTPLSLPDRLI